MALRWVPASIAWLAFSAAGCDDACRPAAQPTIGAAATELDYRIEMSPGQVVLLALGGEEAERVITGGEAVVLYDPGDTACVALGCQFLLKRFRLDLGTFTIETSAGAIELAELSAGFQARVPLAENAGVYDVPAGTLVDTVVTVDGRPDHGQAPLEEAATLYFLPPTEFAVTGRLPLRLRVDGDACDELTGELSGTVNGMVPFAQLPSAE